jgi:hypothetical protein
MEHEGSLSYSQQPATGPYHETDASNPNLPSYFPKIYSNIIIPSTPRLPSGLFLSDFPTNILHAFFNSHNLKIKWK